VRNHARLAKFSVIARELWRTISEFSGSAYGCNPHLWHNEATKRKRWKRWWTPWIGQKATATPRRIHVTWCLNKSFCHEVMRNLRLAAPICPLLSTQFRTRHWSVAVFHRTDVRCVSNAAHRPPTTSYIARESTSTPTGGAIWEKKCLTFVAQWLSKDQTWHGLWISCRRHPVWTLSRPYSPTFLSQSRLYSGALDARFMCSFAVHVHLITQLTGGGSKQLQVPGKFDASK